jgi:hypothetical protein
MPDETSLRIEALRQAIAIVGDSKHHERVLRTAEIIYQWLRFGDTEPVKLAA